MFTALPVESDVLSIKLNTIIELGEYFQNLISNATPALNYPEAVASALNGVDAGACR